MRARASQSPQAGFRLAGAAAAAAAAALLLASCSSGPSTPSARQSGGHRTGATTSSSSTPVTATPSTLPSVPTSGPLQAGTAIALPFSADRVTAAESPDGAVFVAPQQPTSPAPGVAWVVDGDGPAAVAEHVPTGIAALAADSTNFYAATYSTVYAYNRASGNQDGQWPLPPVATANSSNEDLVAMVAAGGNVFVSVTEGDTVSVYRITPSSSAAPQFVLRSLGATIGPDGSVYYETTDHHLAVQRPDGTTVTGPALAATPNGLGGGVQYVQVVAGGALWVGEPAGQGLDSTETTYDATSLAEISSYVGTVTSTVADTAAGALVLMGAGTNPQCPQSAPSSASSCVLRIDTHGDLSDPVVVGAAVTLLGPAPAVVESDTSTGQFDLVRLS